MRKSCQWLFVAVVCLSAASAASGQGLLGPGPPGPGEQNGPCHSPWLFPYARLGAASVRLELDSHYSGASDDLASVTLKVKDAPFAVASLGFGAALMPDLTVTLVAAANAQRSLPAETRPDQLYGVESATPGRPVEWTGSRFQWWAIDGSISYPQSAPLVAILGARLDHLDLRLRTPVPLEGDEPADLIARYGADLQSKVQMVYFGLQTVRPNWKARFIGSPFVRLRTALPFRVLELDDFGQPDAQEDLKEQRYLVQDRAWCLEGAFEYLFQTRFQNCRAGFWLDASWINATGGIDNSYSEAEIGGPFFYEEQANGTFSRRMCSLGISASMSF